jgi:hypothetical protein
MPDPKPLPPLGRAIRRTAEQRKQVATITPADVLAGRMLWHATAPAGWQGLIEAKVERTDDTARE